MKTNKLNIVLLTTLAMFVFSIKVQASLIEKIPLNMVFDSLIVQSKMVSISESSLKDTTPVILTDELPEISGALTPFIVLCEHEIFAIAPPKHNVNGKLVADGFQFSQDVNFSNPIIYDGSFGIGMNYNKWFVRYFIQNTSGIVYSNTAQLHVKLSAEHVTLKWDDVLVYNDEDHDIMMYQWYFNDQRILGGNKQYCPVSKSEIGYYSVHVVTVGGEKLQTCPISVTTRKPVQQKINIYPNPAICDMPFELELLGIENEDLNSVNIKIFTIDGILAYEQNGVNSTISSVQLSYGTYIARVQLADGEIITTKILVYNNK